MVLRRRAGEREPRIASQRPLDSHQPHLVDEHHLVHSADVPPRVREQVVDHREAEREHQDRDDEGQNGAAGDRPEREHQPPGHEHRRHGFDDPAEDERAGGRHGRGRVRGDRIRENARDECQRQQDREQRHPAPHDVPRPRERREGEDGEDPSSRSLAIASTESAPARTAARSGCTIAIAALKLAALTAYSPRPSTR